MTPKQLLAAFKNFQNNLEEDVEDMDQERLEEDLIGLEALIDQLDSYFFTPMNLKI